MTTDPNRGSGCEKQCCTHSTRVAAAAGEKASTSAEIMRRGFLQASSAAVSTLLLGDLFPGRVHAQDANTAVQLTSFPRVRVVSLAELERDTPIEFFYPSEALHTACMIVKLGRTAGGGIGPDQDIVAFSTRCTHMGGEMSNGYVPKHKLIGCDVHLTTFDMTRHGIMVAGHATETLPQIVLELDGDDIYAIGIIGLLYGYSQNPQS